MRGGVIKLSFAQVFNNCYSFYEESTETCMLICMNMGVRTKKRLSKLSLMTYICREIDRNYTVVLSIHCIINSLQPHACSTTF